MEFPVFEKAWKRNMKKFCIVYPNLYYGGVYCLAPLIIYNIVNSRKDWICDRAFLDKRKKLQTYDLVGFTLQYELDLRNVMKIVREDKPKISFAGGPCVNLNYKILEGVVDFFVIGEIEAVLEKILESYEENKEKKEFLKKISKFKGVFVPGLSKKAEMVNVENLDEVMYPIVQPFPEKINKNFVFGNVFILEIERGCPMYCRFCAMPFIYRKVRHRSLEKIKEIIDNGIKVNKRKKVVIYSPSFTHPQKKEILMYLLKKKLKFSVPSLNVKFVNEELLRLIKSGGQKTLTIAPECGETLRFKIGKFAKDEKFFEFVKFANELNFETIKLYFMIGLPGQDEKDLDEIIKFVERVKKEFNRRVYVSVNPFVPKPKTEFEKWKFDKKEAKKQLVYLKKNLKVKSKFGNVNTSYLEWKYAFKN